MPEEDEEGNSSDDMKRMEKDEQRKKVLLEKIMKQKINYDNFNVRIFGVHSQGIQVVFINDNKNSFYPVLSFNLLNFKFMH